MNIFTKVVMRVTALITVFTMVVGIVPATAAAVTLPESTPTCSVIIASIVDGDVPTTGGVKTYVHPNWTTAIAGGQWLWSDATVVDTTVTVTKNFSQTFVWGGDTVTGIDFQFAADNGYVVKLNGNVIGSGDNTDHFSSVTQLTINPADVVVGVNTLVFSITNLGVADSNSENNPAGFVFKLIIDGTGTTCDEIPPVDVCENIEGNQASIPKGYSLDGNACYSTESDTYEIYGFVWDDVDEDDSKEVGEAGLSNWTVRAVNASNSEQVITDTTDATGRYSLNVPAGTWIISQLTESGWVLLSNGNNGNGTYTVKVPVEEPALSFLNWLIPTAQAAALNEVAGPFSFGNNEIENTVTNNCLIPDSLDDNTPIIMQSSGEKSVAQMLAEHGYSAVDITADQQNFQVWNLADLTASSVTFKMRVLGKRAGNTQIVGYYKAGNAVTFTPVLTQAADTDGDAVVSVSIPAAFANSFGFAIQSADKTWFSEKSLNSDALEHLAVFNPSANTYLLAFEDFNNLGDGDYNDIVIEISDVVCQKSDTVGNEVVVRRGGGGTRVQRAPAGEVLGASTSTPSGLVLGAATTTMPVGAPNTGAGGTSAVVINLPTVAAILPKTQRIK